MVEKNFLSPRNHDTPTGGRDNGPSLTKKYSSKVTATDQKKGQKMRLRKDNHDMFLATTKIAVLQTSFTNNFDSTVKKI